eukprot:scaffold2533_cov15-Prasinocladus_malaysianus.AAC.1
MASSSGNKAKSQPPTAATPGTAAATLASVPWYKRPVQPLKWPVQSRVLSFVALNDVERAGDETSDDSVKMSEFTDSK